jgi:hypothetical protein
LAAPEEGDEEGPPTAFGFQDLDEGVRFFIISLIALVAGFILALRGFVLLPVILGTCAIISLLTVILRPSREALAKRAGKAAAEEGEDEVEEDKEEGSDLLLEDAPAPTSTRREAPTPPPEPPPMDEVIVDLEEEDEGSATQDDMQV